MNLTLPLTIPVSKNSKFILNLNNYRNAHFLVLSKAKYEYSKVVSTMLPEWNRAQYKIEFMRLEHEAAVKSIRKKKGEALAIAYENEQRPALEHKIGLLKDKYGSAPSVAFTTPVELIYSYYHGNNRLIDVCNPCSIIDKFTCDALTMAAVWGDDHSGIVVSSTYRFAGVDKANPRCELIVRAVG